MNSKECEQQLKELIEAWDLNEALLNQTDIEAIKHLMLENQIQQDTIKTQKLVIGNLSDRITKAIEYIKNENLRIVDISKEIPELCDGELLEILKGKSE